MIGEIELQGVLITPLLAWMFIAYALTIPIKKTFSWCGFYRLVWHSALFDVSLFIVLTGAVSVVVTDWIGQ